MRAMKQRVSILTLVSLLSVLPRAGYARAPAQTEPGKKAMQPRDLGPVAWMKPPKHKPVEIVRDGKAGAVVYVADPAGRKDWTPKRKGEQPSTLKRLVDELDTVVRLATGASLEFVTNPPPAGTPAIVIGDCEETREAGIAAAELPPEGFTVKTAPNRVYLVGSTQAAAPGSDQWAKWGNEGAAWAVADFLERVLDVRWYWPAEVGGRCITRRATLAVPPLHYRDEPVFRQREYHPWNGWRLPTTARSSDRTPLPFASNAIPEGVTAIEMAGYLPLLRGGCSWPYKVQCHEPQNLGGLPGEFREQNQDMFALKKDGARNYNMFCYSSPKALDYLLAGCERAWDGEGKKGDSSWVTATCVTVSPGDSKVDCQCPACLATVARAGGTPIDGASLVMAEFVKRMCEAVKQRWPDKKVIYLSYWNYDKCPPGVDYPDNLAVMSAMTTYPMPLNAQRANFEEAVERLKAWRSKACLPVTVWDYCVVSMHGPYQYPHAVRDFYEAARGTVAGVFINGWTLSDWSTTAPTLYVWMKALWNPDLDVDAVLDEMCRRLYGRAGDTAREMIRLECALWESGAWQTERVKIPGGWYVPEDMFPRVWTADIVGRLKALRNRALAELADDPVARQRFLYWTWTFDVFLRDAEAAAVARPNDPGR